MLMIVNNCILILQIVCCVMWHAHVESVKLFPRGMLYLMWDCNVLMLDLLGTYCEYRLIKMSCWMSSGNDNPTISVYILCVSAHIVVIMCVLY